jgi:ParB family chromosome partitioning protein
MTKVKSVSVEVGNSNVEYVAYALLCKSPLNVRKKTLTGIEGLAANIDAKGLLQNLVVHSFKPPRAKQRKLAVCAGQRRLAALDLLFSQGKITKDHLVPVKVVSEGEAVSTSLIENSMREPMCPADQCHAFKLLIDENKSIQDIADLFSVSHLVVQRRLKLASVSPALLELYRNDAMRSEQIMALSLSDDHEIQERVWADAVEPWQREPRVLREAITKNEVDASRNHLARFVGVAAYEAAGGYVRRDLFSDEQNAGFITDSDLLHRLATDKLMAASQELAAKGWGWIETRTKREHGETLRFGHLQTVTREATADEQAEFDALIAKRDSAIAALDAAYESDDDTIDGDKLEEEADAASEAADAFAERFEAFAPEDMKSAGAFIVINSAGELEIERGLVRREDVATLSSNGGQPSSFGQHAAPVKKEKPVHGEKLCRRLTAHRTAAVQVELMRQPTVALAVTMQRLVPIVFREHYLCSHFEHAVKLSAQTSRAALANEADDMETSIAWVELEAQRAKWLAVLPKNVNTLLPWLLEQEAATMADLFAYCAAAMVDGISSVDKPHQINALADLLNVDMSYYWSPTRASYLDHVSKARISEVVADAVSPEAARNLSGMKKIEAAATAEVRLADKGWLPEVLTNRETPEVYSYGSDDEEDEERSSDLDDDSEA